jgi:hypothetical protein
MKRKISKSICKYFCALATAIWLGISSGPASAYQVFLDQFAIYKNGLLLMHDRFDDGNPPPASGSDFGGSGIPATYNTRGTWTESGGRAVADSTVGPYFDPAEVYFGNPTLEHRGFVNTNTQPVAENDSGLKIDDEITVYGLFDLSSTLDVNNSSYNIRLMDQAPGRTVADLNDQARIGVRRDNDGSMIIRWGDYDASTGTVTFKDTVAFAPGSEFDQILLALHRAAPDGGDPNPEVTASFAYVDGTVDLGDTGALSALSFTTLAGSVAIFDGEEFTRAGFAVFEQNLEPLPEPAGAALLGLGFLTLAGRARLRASRA